MARLYFIILQVVLCSAIAALYLSGHLQVGESKWFVAGVAAVAAVGLILTALGRAADAAKLQDMLPVVAVIAMQFGIVAALGGMGLALSQGGDPARAAGVFFSALSAALYVSISALTSYLWLRITLWLAYGQ